MLYENLLNPWGGGHMARGYFLANKRSLNDALWNLTLFPMGSGYPLFPMGGGQYCPLAENRPLSVKKIRIFKNEPSENALPTPRNPT